MAPPQCGSITIATDVRLISSSALHEVPLRLPHRMSFVSGSERSARTPTSAQSVDATRCLCPLARYRMLARIDSADCMPPLVTCTMRSNGRDGFERLHRPANEAGPPVHLRHSCPSYVNLPCDCASHSLRMHRSRAWPGAFSFQSPSPIRYIP